MAVNTNSRRVVMLDYACPKCGKRNAGTYSMGYLAQEWERDFGDLPDCARNCVVPFEVLSAVADWLDEALLAYLSTRGRRS